MVANPYLDAVRIHVQGERPGVMVEANDYGGHDYFVRKPVKGMGQFVRTAVDDAEARAISVFTFDKRTALDGSAKFSNFEPQAVAAFLVTVI